VWKLKELKGVVEESWRQDVFYDLYRADVRKRYKEVVGFLKEEVEQGRDCCLLCHELEGDFCHRIFLFEFLAATIKKLGLDVTLSLH
jgi:hypothetical protein